jgi:hypothetical protein
VDKGKIWK